MSRRKPHQHYDENGLKLEHKPKGWNKNTEKRIERALHRRDPTLWLRDDADL